MNRPYGWIKDQPLWSLGRGKPLPYVGKAFVDVGDGLARPTYAMGKYGTALKERSAICPFISR